MRRILLRWLIALLALSAVASLFFLGKVREENARIDGFVLASTRGISRADTEAVALALAREVFRQTNRTIRADELPLYERIESTSLFNVTSAVSLKHGVWGVDGRAHDGPCGTMTRVTLVALDRAGIAARKLHLTDEGATQDGWHTLVEFRSGGRWLVLSPSDSAFAWRTHEGRIATLEEIQADSTIFAEILERFPSYPYRIDHATHIRWEKLPRPARAVARAILGHRLYDQAFTPRVYDQPRRLFLMTSLIALGTLGLGALLASRPWRHSEALAQNSRSRRATRSGSA